MVYTLLADLINKGIKARVFKNTLNLVTATKMQMALIDMAETLWARAAGVVVDYKYIAVVDPNGNDSTGAIGITKPFKTLAAANAAMDAISAPYYAALIIVNPGTLTVGENPFRFQTNYFFHKGAVLINTTGSIVHGKFDCAIYGYGEFQSTGAPTFLFDNSAQYAQGLIEFSFIYRSDAGHVVEFNDGGDADILFRGTVSNGIGNASRGQILATNGNTVYLVSTNNTKNIAIRFKNCLINNITGGTTVFGNILATASSYVLIENSIVNIQDDIIISNTIQFQAGSCDLAIFNTRIKAAAAATYSVVVPKLYYDNNVLANKPTNNVADIGPGTTIQVDAAYDKIFV